MEESLQQLIMQAIQELLAHQVDIFLFAYHFMFKEILHNPMKFRQKSVNDKLAYHKSMSPSQHQIFPDIDWIVFTFIHIA